MSHFSQVAWLSVVFERLYGTVFGDEIFPSFLRDIAKANEKPGQSHGAIRPNIVPVFRSTSKINGYWAPADQNRAQLWGSFSLLIVT